MTFREGLECLTLAGGAVLIVLIPFVIVACVTAAEQKQYNTQMDRFYTHLERGRETDQRRPDVSRLQKMSDEEFEAVVAAVAREAQRRQEQKHASNDGDLVEI